MKEERAFQRMADAAPFPMWLGDPQGNCVFLNAAWIRFTGQPAAEALGGGWAKMIHPEDMPALLAAFLPALEARQAYQVEYRVRRADGVYRWMIDSASPRFDGAGRFLGFVGSLVDIGDRKEAEIAVHAAEQRLRIATRSAGIGIWEWDLASNSFIFSPRALEIFGFAPAERIDYEQLRSALHPEDLETVRRESERARDPAIRSTQPYRYRIIRPADGEIRWIVAHGEAEFDGPGSDAGMVRYIGTFQDVTEEQLSEETIRDSEARLRMALDAAGLVLWELDMANDTLTPSRELNEMFGFAPDEPVTPKVLRERYAPGEGDRLARLGAEARARGETSLETEFQHIWPDGTRRWALLMAQAAPPTRTSGPRAIGVLLDTTERKRNEERLKVVASELQHRVKNTLAVVQTIANQTFRGMTGNEEAVENFTSRLRALALATEAVTRGDGTEAQIIDVVEGALSPYRDESSDPFILLGQEALVPGRSALAISLGLHELCTNAAKYGALSSPSGKVLLDWNVSGSQLNISWREEGGPAVAAPSRTGFGTRLLKRGLFGNGSVEIDYLPGGLRCTIEAALEG